MAGVLEADGVFAPLAPAVAAPVPCVFFSEALLALLRTVALEPLLPALSRPDLWHEAAVLERLLYKSKAAHRGSRHFERLRELARRLRALRALQLGAQCELLSSLLPRTQPGSALPTPASLPSRAFAELTARRLLACARLAASLRRPCQAAAKEAAALLAATYFMPLALASLSLTARCAASLRALHSACCQAFNALAPLLPHLPAPLSEGSSAPPLPLLLRCEWGAVDSTEAVGELPGGCGADDEMGAAVAREAAAAEGVMQAPVFVDRMGASGVVPDVACCRSSDRPRYALMSAPGRGRGRGRHGGRGGALDLLLGL